MSNLLGPYDELTEGDNTGQMFRTQGRGQNDLQANLRLFRNAKLVCCPECGNELWRIIADDHPLSALFLQQCPRCKASTRPAELRKPQLDDYRAKEMGLYVPNQGFLPPRSIEDLEGLN